MNVRAKNISKYFYRPGKELILNSISMEVDYGELVSVYGESGSGKSTLLYILATLDRDYEGELVLTGRKIALMSEEDLAEFRNRHIGFVYQFHYLLPEFNVLQNVMLPGLKAGHLNREEVEESALSLLKLVGLSSFESRPAYQLSGGQQQRVAIARALVNDPAIVIADEPTGNLDQKNGAIVFELLKEIAEERGKSVVIATHNLNIREKSHRSVEMIDGFLRL